MDYKLFGNFLLETLDLDPLYVILSEVEKWPDDTLKRFMVGYWVFYSAGVSAKLAESKDFYEAMFYGDANRWPRGHERRHMRGKQFKDAINGLKDFGPPEKVFDVMTNGSDFQTISANVQKFRGFGPWISWKVADMAERICGFDVDFSNCEINVYADPVKGAALIGFGDQKYKISKEEVVDVFDMMQSDFGHYDAPPFFDRKVNIQETETIACKWKSYVNKHYPMGNDTFEIFEGLEDWGDLADDLSVVMEPYVEAIEDKLDGFDEGELITEPVKEKPKQEFRKLAKSIDSGKDGYGPYEIIPISMVRGGVLEPKKVHTDPIKHIVNSSNPSPRGWYKDKHVPDRVRPRPCYSESLLTTPFGGFCHIGCSFCYVDHGTRGYRATGLATASPGYPESYAKQISKMQIAPAAYISSFTEPFQLLEDSYHITQRLSRMLLDEGLPLYYLSRILPPDWVEDMLLENPYNYMQWSINTSDETQYRKLSPGSYSLEEVFNRMEKMAKQGIYVSVQVNPVLPGISSLEDILELVRLVAKYGGRHVIFKFAEQVSGNKKILFERLYSTKLPGVDEFEKLLNQFIGGVYTIDQSLRVNWLEELLAETANNGITMSTCYEYYANGKGGANLAPWFTTSDQCHGRGVPMFYRPEPGEKFEPLPGCYRKGCLYCEDYGTKACNNEILLQAKALKYKDYREIKLVGEENDWNLVDSCYPPEDILHSPARNEDFQTDSEIWDLGDVPEGST